MIFLNSNRAATSRRRGQAAHQRRLAIESLEQRRMLAAPEAVDDAYVVDEDQTGSIPVLSARI